MSTSITNKETLHIHGLHVCRKGHLNFWLHKFSFSSIKTSSRLLFIADKMVKGSELIKLYCTLALITITSVNTQHTAVDPNVERLLPLYRLLRDSATATFANPQEHKILLEENRKLGRLQNIISNSTKFFCDVKGPGRRSSTPPTSVHKLRPGDIDIVGSLGDSLSGGTAILVNDIIGVLVDNRGIVFTTGGDSNWREFLTLSNILREYNPNLNGYATVNAPTYAKAARFNAAEAFAMSKDMKYQAQNLYKRMKADPKVDMQKHWKVITIFMGHNDFCSENCYVGNFSQIIKNHKTDVSEVLRFIRDTIPRVFVNYLPIANIKELLLMKGSPEFCDILHTSECSCMFRPEFQGTAKKDYFEMLKNWIEADYEVVSRAEFHNKEDFTVVIQPFITYAKLPRLKNGLNDFRYLAFDCFHFSQRGHAAFTTMLWNNMLQPEGTKEITWTYEFSHIECPTEQRPYLATAKNSGK